MALFIARNIVAGMHALIELHSREGEGTTVEIVVTPCDPPG
jgi:signal transduction histidine kinase